MTNKITEKYFTQGDFSKLKAKALKEVAAETGFSVDREIFRGMIYDPLKVGSLIFKGSYQGKPAVLKLQGLKPHVEESVMIKSFNRQNQSKKIRLPKLYLDKTWNEKTGYGYLITELIEAPKLFRLPFADHADQKLYADFFQEYRTKALVTPWLPPDALNSLELTLARIKNWRKISEFKKHLAKDDYLPYLNKYLDIIPNHLEKIPLVFCHGHLTADDIFRLPDNTYVLMSNLFWCYRPQWYELAFNLWACLVHINDTSYTFKKIAQYIETWISVYRSIPVVQTDRNFNHTILTLLLERIIGIILVDLGATEFFGRPKNQSLLKHQLKLHHQLFDYLISKLSSTA